MFKVVRHMKAMKVFGHSGAEAARKCFCRFKTIRWPTFRACWRSATLCQNILSSLAKYHYDSRWKQLWANLGRISAMRYGARIQAGKFECRLGNNKDADEFDASWMKSKNPDLQQMWSRELEEIVGIRRCFFMPMSTGIRNLKIGYRENRRISLALFWMKTILKGSGIGLYLCFFSGSVLAISKHDW